MVPYNPDKVYNSRLTRAGHQNSSISNPGSPKTPQKTQLTNEQTLMMTPYNSYQLGASIRALSTAIKPNRSIRTWMGKVQKGFQTSNTREATAIYTYKGVQAKLDSMRDKRGRTKVSIDPNTMFADIDAIKASQEEEQTKITQYQAQNPETSLIETSQLVQNTPMQSFMYNYQL